MPYMQALQGAHCTGPFAAVQDMLGPIRMPINKQHYAWRVGGAMDVGSNYLKTGIKERASALLFTIHFCSEMQYC